MAITAKCPARVSRSTRAEDPTCSSYGRTVSSGDGSVKTILKRQRTLAAGERVAKDVAHMQWCDAQRAVDMEAYKMRQAAAELGKAIEAFKDAAAAVTPAPSAKLLQLQAHFNSARIKK